MQIDLHFHSTVSDGSSSPQDLAKLCVEGNIKIVSLTDHDTIDGTSPFYEAIGGAAQVIRGVEISCSYGKQTVHLLAYDANLLRSWGRVEKMLVRQRQLRAKRAELICDRLEELGKPVDRMALREKSKQKVIGRPDIAMAMLNAGYCRTRREVFEKYLGDGKPADIPIERLSVFDAIDCVHSCGGKTSIAHPHQLRDLGGPIIKECADKGLDGLEVNYGPYSRSEKDRWLKVAVEHGLFPTTGSDLHDTAGKHSLGMEVTEEYVDGLGQWLAD